MIGRIANLAGGSAAADGIIETVAVKGSRKADLNDRTGRIIDLVEERVYELDVRRKEYRVVTFAQLREQWQKAKEDAERAAKDRPADERDDPADQGKEVEILLDVKETGARKSIAGHNASQVILTVTAKEKGKDLEEGGGLVITSDVWVAPRVAALDEITKFTTKFLQAVYGDDAVASAQQMATVMAMYPSLQEMMTKLEEKTRALDGTVMTTVTKIETIKSAEAMKRSSAPPTGGLGGALARRLGAGRAPEQRSLVLTSAGETQSIDTSASDADVAIPAGFKERK
ncbi:MAG: hypothetical protein FJW21_03460 [Acidimicrobiia bacterium]|nr:hypothetical protein [Acidimicrobiia bacterium]